MDGPLYGSDHIFYGDHRLGRLTAWGPIPCGKQIRCPTTSWTPKEYHVELFPGKDGTIVLENDKRPNLTIWKRDADSGAPIEGRYSW